MNNTMLDMPYTSAYIMGSLSNRLKIQESCYYTGVIDQVDLILDMDRLLEEANLTEKQLQVIQLYYFNQYTQDEVSKKMGISQQAVLDHLKKVKVKISKVVEVWRVKDGK